ncbi:polysaccharide deacetylase family protein, partial [Streptomyces sp. SID6139]|nr:polysaccharide deacetylase family protein [Streptomyces sp. SID6139]
MARHAGRGWYGRVIGAAAAVTAVAAGASVWTAQAGQNTPAAPAHHTAPKTVAVSPVIAHSSDGGAHAVNITIDDGPDPTWTPQVLQVLRENGVKATFCMIGPEAQAHPDVVKQVVAAGHRLCDHTVSH